MPSSDCSSAVGGGLKLKGSGAGGSVDKKKKKKKSKSQKPAEEANEKRESEELHEKKEEEQEGGEEKGERDESTALRKAEAKEYGKTEAQRRFEERRKKRLGERLQREGVQTHKERVQQLNKYLSTLSEHNDMPRIGPG